MGLLSAIFVFFQSYFNHQSTTTTTGNGNNKDIDDELSIDLSEKPSPSSSIYDQTSNIDTETSLIDTSSNSSSSSNSCEIVVGNDAKQKSFYYNGTSNNEFDEKRRCGKYRENKKLIK